MKLIIGIDATNLRKGGGVTHIVELLRAAEPELLGIERIVIWGSAAVLDMLDNPPWLKKCTLPIFNKGRLSRYLWQGFCLTKAVQNEKCNVLFVPGGTYIGNFHTVVTLNQNLMPFDIREMRRYGWSLYTCKHLLLRLTQMRTLRRSKGVIFLTKHAHRIVSQATGILPAQNHIIPHGLSPRFFTPPKPQRLITDYSDAQPFRILYASNIDQYKHQWYVAEAVGALRKQGMPVVLDLVGDAYPSSLRKLNKTITLLDPDRHWVNYHGTIPYEELHGIYTKADLGIIASTCESFGMILLEKMGAGLPIACSAGGAAHEIIGDAAVYFNSEQPKTITDALHKMIASPQLRTELAHSSYQRALQYSWRLCSKNTLEVLIAASQQS